MNASIIDRLIEHFLQINSFLMETRQISMSLEINNHYRKIILFSCASLYEHELSKSIKELFMHRTGNSEQLVSFVFSKAIDRQYHTYFDWKNGSINTFLSLWGEGFKKMIKNKIAQNKELKEAMESFLEMGRERNCLAHENFLDYNLEKSVEEVIGMHKKASLFVDFLITEITQMGQ